MSIRRELIRELRYGLRHPLVRAGLWAMSAGLVAVAVACAYWWPAAREHHRLAEEIADSRRSLVRHQQTVELRRAYEQAQASVPLLEGKLEQAASQARLVEELGRLARGQGLRVIGEAYEDSRRGAPGLATDLSVQGTYSAVRGFIDGLDGLPTWSVVDELRLEQQGTSGEVRARLRVVTYVRRAAAGEGGRT